MHPLKTLALAGVLALASMSSVFAAEVKIGFIVKQPEEPWFQDEWKYADIAAREKGFTLIKIAGQDGEKVMAALDNLGAQGAQGVIICTPDVKLGTGIVARAAANGLKLMSVDDRLVDASGKPLAEVPHMGISARKIGEEVGKAISDEVRKRGWNWKDIGAIRVSYDQLPTAVDRTEGAISVLKAAGLPQTDIFDAPQAATDTEAAMNASTIVLNKEPNIKHWVAVGLNDEAVLGAVRATESAGIPAGNVIAVGIGGSDSAISEFKKPKPTGFFGTVIISPKRHGYETAVDMYDWITKGKEPPKLTLTTGLLATRADYAAIRKELGLQ